MKTTRVFCTGLALLLSSLFSGCDSGSSTGSSTSNPESNIPSNSLVGTWSTSTAIGTANRLIVVTYRADSTFSETNTTTALGTTSGNRISGTWSVDGSTLTQRITKTETSSDGANWASTIVPGYTLSGDYVVAGGILSYDGSGIEVRYVQGNSGLVPPETILPPIISPAGGTFNTSQLVTLAPANLGADIYYTLDGSTPQTYSTQTNGTVLVAKSLTIKAIAEKNGKKSEVASATFTIEKDSSDVGSFDTKLAGTWILSEAGYLETMTIGSTGSFTIVSVDSTAAGSDRFTRVTGTMSTSDGALIAAFKKMESSSNGTNWSTVSTSLFSDTQNYLLSGTTLTLIDDAGDKTVYTRKD